MQRHKSVLICGTPGYDRLGPYVRERLDGIMEKGYRVVMGGYSSTEEAVQKYLHGSGYRNVVVYCCGRCKHNVGKWPEDITPKVVDGKRNGFYLTKRDIKTYADSDYCFAIVEGYSNFVRQHVEAMLREGKPTLIFWAYAGSADFYRDDKDFVFAPRKRGNLR